MFTHLFFSFWTTKKLDKKAVSRETTSIFYSLEVNFLNECDDSPRRHAAVGGRGEEVVEHAHTQVPRRSPLSGHPSSPPPPIPQHTHENPKKTRAHQRARTKLASTRSTPSISGWRSFARFGLLTLAFPLTACVRAMVSSEDFLAGAGRGTGVSEPFPPSRPP